uniref:Uncharacterized protein LOC104229782 n=1 Tax=Nicotiana sylvestris TaxID=4096 RepID=A0A1U7WQC4_NICSY|nr:PREDICTED: uncharacterized protein LOC104229782 [Nicotiana sylvestris]
MSFGLKNVGATYQRLVTKMFKEQLGKTTNVYIDNMLVKSKKKEDHIGHLKKAFDILRQYGIKLSPKKCAFGITSGKFLVFLVSQRGIEVNQDQIRAIEGIPETLTSKKQVQKLTGRIAALSRFISRSSDRCHKLFNVLRKDHELQWNLECVDALRRLKAYLSSPPLLVKADSRECLLVYLAVSEVAVSAVLIHENKEFDECRLDQIARAQNTEADGLAKLVVATRNINKENVVTLLHSAIDQVEDGTLPQDKKEAKKHRIQAARYILVNCHLYKRTFGGPLAKCLGPNQIRQVLEEVHEGHCGAHTSNRALVLCLVRAGYYWPTMKKEVADYVRKCEQCQKYAPMIHQAGELLHSITSPWPFIKWGMDIVGPLPAGRGKVEAGETPYSLVYETDAVIPVEVGEPSLRYSNESSPSNDESRLQDLDEVEELRDMAYVRMVAKNNK